MKIKILSIAVSSAIVLMCAGTTDALGGPPPNAGPPNGGGPPGLADSPGNSDFGHSQGGGSTYNEILPPSTFECFYDSAGVVATWPADREGVCGPEYGGDLEFDVDYKLECTEGDLIPDGMRTVEFDLDTDPEAVWSFSCEGTCDAEGSWADIDAAIDVEMDTFFETTCGLNGGGVPVAGALTGWMHSEAFAEYDGIFADVKGLCPGKFKGRQNHEKIGDACQSAY